MLSDPQSVTIGSSPGAVSCPRVIVDGPKAIYRSADDTVNLTVSHLETKDGRMRHMARIDRTVVAADPISAQNSSKAASVYVVIDQPSFGFTDTQLYEMFGALNGWLLANTGAICYKILGNEI